MIQARELPIPNSGLVVEGVAVSLRGIFPVRERCSVVIQLFSLVWGRVFRCRHKRCTSLITCRPGQPRSKVAAMTGTYFVCLDCCKEFAYDWENMRVIDPDPTRMNRLMQKATQL
jgi:hypothetical protein